MDRSVIVRKGGLAVSHIDHGPDPEAVKALRISAKIKRQAQENDDRPPTAVMREEYDADEAAQAHTYSGRTLILTFRLVSKTKIRRLS